MSLLLLVAILCMIGGIGYLVNVKYASHIAGWIKALVNLLLVITAVVLVLDAVGLWDKLRGVKVPTL